MDDNNSLQLVAMSCITMDTYNIKVNKIRTISILVIHWKTFTTVCIFHWKSFVVLGSLAYNICVNIVRTIQLSFPL